MNDTSPPDVDDQAEIKGLVMHQLWGFICPGLNVLAPLLYRLSHKSPSPRVKKTFFSVMNLQISWSIYLFIPMVFMYSTMREMDLMGMLEDLRAYNNDPYMAELVDPISLIQPLTNLLLFFFTEFLLTLAWVSVTLRFISRHKKGDINYNGLLSIPFFR